MLNPDSTIDVPTAPGLGVTLESDRLEEIYSAELRLDAE